MRDFVKNMGYFLSEVRTIFSLNGFSSVLSIVSLILIFFVALLAVSGWWVSSDLVKALQNEAEISVYYSAALNEKAIETLQKSIRSIDGVKSVTPVKAEEAYDKMSKILGQDAKVLSNFEKNPFEAYFEVNIELEKLDTILKAVEKTADVEYVRDNQTILEKLSRVANAVTILGIVIAAAVSASTFIITSHIIREGVHSHRDQINTLKLLGAPDWFINTPFILEGVLLTLASGIVSSVLFAVFASRFERLILDAVLFTPHTDGSAIIQILAVGMMLSSAAMGFAASLFGLKMVQTK